MEAFAVPCNTPDAGGVPTVMRTTTRDPVGQATRHDLALVPLDAEQHEAFLTGLPHAPFLQLPAWAEVKPEWTSHRLGWRTPRGDLAATALVLQRWVPHLRRCLAYVPDGPVVAPGHLDDVPAVLASLARYERAERAFALRVGPALTVRRWASRTVRSAIAAGATTVPDVPPDAVEPAGAGVVRALRDGGWRPVGEGAGFAAGQPRFCFEVPLAGRGIDDLFAGLSQGWRRNIRTAERLGVDVREGDAADLAAFHALYLATARRDGFTPRPAAYFERLWAALHRSGAAWARLYVAERSGTPLAAAITVQVGDLATYLYGGSADAGREFKGSNALQWRMLTDAHGAGAAVLDLRGIGASLDAGDPLFGLTRFKLGSGGAAVERVGEWELPLRPLLAGAVGRHLARR